MGDVEKNKRPATESAEGQDSKRSKAENRQKFLDVFR